MPDRYFNRVPSLPATDDRRAGPLAEDLSTGSGDGEDIGGEVALTLSGPATLLGDNPFAFGQHGGLGAVWIRSLAGQPGPITLTASHPLLGQAEVQVRSEPVRHASELA
jgi:hypothetical protein